MKNVAHQVGIKKGDLLLLLRKLFKDNIEPKALNISHFKSPVFYFSKYALVPVMNETVQSYVIDAPKNNPSRHCLLFTADLAMQMALR